MVWSESDGPTPGVSNALPLSKRIFDIVVASYLIMVLSPLFAATALVVLLAIGRPVLFRQTRCGRQSKPFTIGKFRTMTDATDRSGALLPDTERQTRATALLRRLRFDELPQLLVVLRGDMSFVGPRPLAPETIRRHGALGVRRCAVAPGMTGWAQVNGNTRLTEEEKFALDLWYIDNRTLMLDVRIVLLTLRTLALGEIVDRERVDTALDDLRHLAQMPAMPGGEAQ